VGGRVSVPRDGVLVKPAGMTGKKKLRGKGDMAGDFNKQKKRGRERASAEGARPASRRPEEKGGVRRKT